MDNTNNESTPVTTGIDNNAWKLVKPSKDEIDTLTSLLEDYDGIDIESAQGDLNSAFEDAQSTYNQVVEEGNEKLVEIKQLIEGSDWGKSLGKYEDQHDGCNPTLHKLLYGLTGIDDFLTDIDRYDECLEIYSNGHEGNSDALGSVIEDLEALEEFEEVDETLDKDTEDWGNNMNIFDIHLQLSSLPIERAKQLITHVISKTYIDTHKDFRYQLKELAYHYGLPEVVDNNCLFNEVKVVNVGD